MKYLVIGSEGPGFESMEEAIPLLENLVFPSFDLLMKLESEKKILGGGIPIGDRAFVFIIEAASNEELDATLQSLPAWGILQWDVTPLHSFAGRSSQERKMVEEFKKTK